MRLSLLFLFPEPTTGVKGPSDGPLPIAQVQSLVCLAGRGVHGDRFAGQPEPFGGCLTFFSHEVFDAMRRELSLLGTQPWALRRYVFTNGVNLAEYAGRHFEVQGVRFHGLELLTPEPWLETEVGPQAVEWLKGRAGLRARILSDGILRPDAASAPREKTSGERLAEIWPEHEWD